MEINTLASPGLSPLLDAGPLPAVRGAGMAAPAGTGAAAGAVPATASGSPAAAPPSAADLKSAVNSGNKALQSLNQALEFQIDDKSKQTVVKVVDTQTNQVIRQFPSEAFLQMAQNIDAFQAQLIKDKA